MVQIEIINDSDRFYGMRREWNDTLEKSGIENPFLTHEFLSSWWKGFGADRELFVLRVKKDDATIGFAPLMKYRTKLTGIPIQAIGFIANHAVELDFILPQDESLEVYMEQILNHIKKEKNVAIFSYFNQSSKAPMAFKSILDRKRLNYAINQKSALCIDIKGTWKDYLKRKTASFRDENRKKRNRLNRLGELEFVRLNGNFDKDVILGELQSVSSKSWQGKHGVAVLSSKQGIEFYKNILNEWLEDTYIDISLLRLNKRPIAYQVGFTFNGCFYAFDTAYDEEFKELSPGLVVINMLLEQLFNEQKSKRIDFGYAAEYKKRWTESVNPISDLVIFPTTAIGAMLRLIKSIKKCMKQ